MDVGVLDTILDTVATACTGTNIGDYAKSLYAKLIVIDFIDTDELLEVTPKNLRIRKKILDPTMRKRAAFKKAQQG